MAAEGATRPETLRQKDRSKQRSSSVIGSGERLALLKSTGPPKGTGAFPAPTLSGKQDRGAMTAQADIA